MSYYGSGGGSNNSSSWQSHNQKKQSSSSSSSNNNSGGGGGSSFKGQVSNDTNSSPQFGSGGTPNLTQSLIAQFAQAHNLGGLPAALAGFGTWHSQNRMAGNNVVGQTPPSNNSRSTSNGGGKSDYVHHADTLQALFASPPPPPPPTSSSSSYNSGGGSQSRMQSSSASKDPNFSLTGLSRPLAMNAMMSSSSSANSSGSGGSMMRGSSPPQRSSRFEGSTRGSSGGGNSGSSSSSSGGGGGSGHHHSSSSSSSSSRYESSRNNNDDHRDRSSNDRSSYSSSSSSSNSNRYSSSSNNSNNHSNNQQQQQQQMSLAPPPPPQPAQTQQQTQNSLAAAVVNAAVANPLGLAPNPLLAQALLSQLAVAQQPSLVSTNSLLTAALSSLAAQQQAAVAPALTLAGLQAQVQAQQPQPPQQQQQPSQQISQQQQQPQKRRLSNDRRRGSRSRSPQRRTRSRTRSPLPRRSPSRRSRSPVAQRHPTLSSLDFRLGRNLSVTTTNAPGLSNRIVIRRSPERALERVAGGPGGKQINIPRRRGDSRDDTSRDNDRHRSSSIKRKGSRSRSRSPRNSGRSVTATTKPSTNSTTTTSAVKRFATGAAPNTNKPGSNTTFNRTATTTSKPTATPQSKEKEKEKEKESGSTNDSSKSSSTTTTPATTTTTTTAAATTPQPTAQQQLVSKYGSRIPRYPLDQLAANVARLKGRYPTLYVPSDFSNVRYQWHNALPMNRPLKFASSRCMFHIMSKDAHSIHGPNDAVYESSDADYRWTVKVMLLAMPSANEIQKRCLALAEDSSSSKEKHEHPARVVEFLVGNRGKHEPMALGGPWSPSLDGPNPATNTQTLINTAVRTVRSLTGIDLSPCTQWFRILDIQYNRNENYRTVVNRTGTVVNGEDQTTKATSENGNDHESTTNQETPLISLNDDRHIENTVIFLPNVWTLMPTSVEYEKIAAAYKDFIDNPPLVSTSKPNGTANVAAKTTVENNTDTNNKPVNPNPNPNPKPATPKPAANSNKPEETTTSEKSENVADAPSEEEEKVKTAADEDNNDSKSLKVESEMNGDGEMNGAANGLTIDSLVQSVNKPEPTHYSKLDLKKMRVDDLRVELEARDLDTKGYKPQLLQRLREALQAEKDAEEPPGTETTTTTKIKQEEIEPEDVQIINDDMEVEKAEDEEDETAATNEQFNADYYGNGDENDGDQQLEYDENAGEEGDGGEGGGDDYEVDLACDPNGLIEEADSTTANAAANTTDAATKNTTTTATTAAKPAETKSKVIDLKARPKQTRYEREKIYKLPSTPHIIVHPSATAKSNKFNCHLASLSSLLDYSKDDSKECSFEVFLFAECFNEMLMRDQGFTIFKHLLGLSESQPSSSNATSTTTTTSTTENGNNKRKTSDDTTANTTKKVRTTNEDSNDSESAANKSTPTTISLAKLKPKTVHTDLLLAFTYFDTNRTSHILEHDLEELLLRFGPLNLTRSKLRLLMKKLPTIKDGLINYRVLTDKTSSTTPLPVLYRLPSDDEIVHYALSFEAFLKRVQGFSGADQNTVAADSILVEINGTAIDVPNTLKKLEKAQADLHSLDLKFKSSQDEIDHLKSSNRDTERQKQKLSDELSHIQNKLKYEQKSLKDLEEKYARLKSCMSKIKSSMNRSLDDISDVMKRNHPSEKEKSSSVSRSVERSVEKQIPPSSTTSTSKPTTANSSLNNSQTEPTTTKDKETPNTTTEAVVEKEAAKTANGEVAEEDVTKS